VVKAKGGGWARARVLNVVGDGSSGKTVCALELCFWCWKYIKKIKSKIFPKVKKVTIVYNNAEGAMDFPIEKMYGAQFECEVEWICDKEIESTCRDYARRMRNLKKGEFLLYIIDSWDAIDSFAARKRFDDSIKDDKEQKGSYDTEKQKFASKFFSKVSGTMERNEKDATLLIVSQVRTKIGVTFWQKGISSRREKHLISILTKLHGFVKLKRWRKQSLEKNESTESNQWQKLSEVKSPNLLEKQHSPSFTTMVWTIYLHALITFGGKA
jgi:RecA/RadA recombinase